MLPLNFVSVFSDYVAYILGYPANSQLTDNKKSQFCVPVNFKK